MTSYQKLRELRNQLLHDGTPPLEFGCEIQTGYGVIKYTTDEDYLRRESTARIASNQMQIPNPFSIHGTPVTIAEVLVMLGEVNHGEIVSWPDKILTIGDDVRIDLTRPLSEQEEACGKLLELLSNK